MDRPTARRRRHASSANSVTVADLQAKSTPAEQANVSAIQARAAVEASARTPPHGRPAVPGTALVPVTSNRPPVDASTEPIRVEEVTDEPRAPNRLAKTIVFTLVAMVACGAVTAVAALTDGPPQRLSPSPPVVQRAVLVGPAVIRPDLIIEQLANGTIGGSAADFPGAMSEEPPGQPVDDDLAARVITDFYELMPRRRSEAYTLLGPPMQADGWAAFDASWRGSRDAQVRLRPEENQQSGGLRASVSIEQLDGTVLRLVQRIEVRTVPVDGRPQPRIVGVQLLTAHRE